MAHLSLMDFVKDAKSRIKEVDINAAEGLIAQGYKVLDVREPAEHAAGAIDGSLNIPRGTLEPAADLAYAKGNPALRDQRDAKWLVVCATGGRSALATNTLQQMGFVDVTNMLGGMSAWIEADKPIVTAGQK